MGVKVAEYAGFCFGVKRAYNMVMKLIEDSDNDKIVTYGPLVHNKQIVEFLSKKGVNVVENIDDVDCVKVVIRAHGVPPVVYDKLKNNNVEIIDATCPKVKYVHNLVNEYSKNGYFVLIVGDKTHPEVIGIKGFAGENSLVISSVDEILNLPKENKYFLVSQTTFNKEKFLKITEEIKNIFSNIEIIDTICSATKERQEAAYNLSKESDLMIVIGGKTSSNTKKLYEIAKENCKEALWIETAENLNCSFLKTFKNIGVTAGASTPQWIIKEVLQMVNEQNELNTVETTEEVKTAECTCACENGACEAPQEAADVPAFNAGDIVKGKVMSVTDTEAIVDIGYRQDGILLQRDISVDPEVNPKDVLNAGDEIDVYIVKLEDKNGNLILSKRRADIHNLFEKANELLASKEKISVTVLEEVKGGLVADFEGFRAFIPASHVDLNYVPELNGYIGQTFDVNVIEVDRSKNRIVLSRKQVLENEAEAKKQATLDSLEVDSIVEGTVKKLTEFGAFIDLGGIDGLVHISELSWDKVAHPSDVLAEGDVVKVKVVKLNKETGKITLSIKQTVPDAWSTVDQKYQVGQIVKAVVKRIVTFGAFVELEHGIEGLVHISQIDNEHVKEVKDVLSPEQEVEVKILSIDKDAHKIALSIKQTKEAPVKVKEEKPKAKPEVKKQAPVEEKEEGLMSNLGDLFGDKLSGFFNN